jgi:hypothetical protein
MAMKAHVIALSALLLFVALAFAMDVGITLLFLSHL